MFLGDLLYHHHLPHCEQTNFIKESVHEVEEYWCEWMLLEHPGPWVNIELTCSTNWITKHFNRFALTDKMHWKELKVLPSACLPPAQTSWFAMDLLSIQISVIRYLVFKEISIWTCVDILKHFSVLNVPLSTMLCSVNSLRWKSRSNFNNL